MFWKRRGRALQQRPICQRRVVRVLRLGFASPEPRMLSVWQHFLLVYEVWPDYIQDGPRKWHHSRLVQLSVFQCLLLNRVKLKRTSRDTSEVCLQLLDPTVDCHQRSLPIAAGASSIMDGEKCSYEPSRGVHTVEDALCDRKASFPPPPSESSNISNLLDRLVVV